MKQRIELLDLWRSLCVWTMLVWHACYDLALFGVLPADAMERPLPMLVCWLGAGSFIFISGAVARFGRNTLRRGFLVFCAGAAVTLVSALAGYPVAWGVLQLLGVCMILYALLRERIERRLGPAFAAVCAALFAGTWLLTERVAVSVRWLYPLGFRAADFYSADYFPLLPWVFLFALGLCFGKWLDKRRESALLQRTFPHWLTFCGRHSLVVYLVHQPLLYGLCRLLF